MCVFVKPKQRLSVFFLVWFSTSEAIEEEAEQELNIVLLSHWDNIQSGGGMKQGDGRRYRKHVVEW